MIEFRTKSDALFWPHQHYSSGIFTLFLSGVRLSHSWMSICQTRSSSQSEERHPKLKPQAPRHTHLLLLLKHWRKVTASFLRWSGDLFKSSRIFSGHIQRTDLRIVQRTLRSKTQLRVLGKYYNRTALKENNQYIVHLIYYKIIYLWIAAWAQSQSADSHGQNKVTDNEFIYNKHWIMKLRLTRR